MEPSGLVQACNGIALHLLNIRGVYRHIVLEITTMNFQRNLSSGSRADACGQTETGGYDEADKHFSRPTRTSLKRR